MLAPLPAAAQQAVVSPPLAQAWIDVATFSGLGAMGMPGPGSAAGLGGMLSGMLGGIQKNEFGHTRTAPSGQWVDFTPMVRGQPLQETRQAVPAELLASPLKLVSPQRPQSRPVPDTGFGLVDYQTNLAVDRWAHDKVLLPAATTTCAVPQGIFDGDGAMLRAIAYGSELNLAHLPLPADPKARWEPVWAVKVRVKAVTNAMLGMGDIGGANAGGTAPEATPETEKPSPGSAMPKPMDVLRGILRR